MNTKPTIEEQIEVELEKKREATEHLSKAMVGGVKTYLRAAKIRGRRVAKSLRDDKDEAA